MGLLPDTFKSYRQKFLVCWDIETLESKSELHADTVIQIEALHNVVSIRLVEIDSLMKYIIFLVYQQICQDKRQSFLYASRPSQKQRTSSLLNFLIIFGFWKKYFIELCQLQSMTLYQP